MVTIAGLNKEQVEICDALWACDSQADVEAYIASLETAEDRHEARVMQVMMLAAICDDEVKAYDDCYAARNILDRISGS